MNVRSQDTAVVFQFPFLLKGVDRLLPPGTYRVVNDEELIEGLSFPAYRRLSTLIFVPAQSRGSWEMISVAPADLDSAQARDGALAQGRLPERGETRDDG